VAEGRPVNLTPGIAHGVVWAGDPHRRTAQRVELPVGRAALLGPVQCVRGVPPGPFLWRTDRVELSALLALRLQGLSGILLTDVDGIGRHGLTLAAGMGIPIVLNARGEPGQRCTIGGAPMAPSWRLRLPEGAISVRAAHQASPGSVELVCGQPEELALLAPHLKSGAVTEIGLLRVEHLVLLDPGMGEGDLTGHLTRILAALGQTPTAVRPATWAPDKPRPDTFRLSATAQFSCLRAAALAAGHDGVTALRRSSDPIPAGLRWAPFLESAEERAVSGRPAWIGLGDLSAAAGSAQAVQAVLDRMALEAGGPLRLCGVAGNWPDGPVRAG
jgi:hypothetical protein